MHSISGYIIKQIVIWYTLPIVFLFIYIIHFHNPSVAIIDHLYAITLIALTNIFFKICTYQFIKNKSVALILSSVLYSATLFSLIIYYILVFTGLASWGRVITEEIILSYVNHMQQLFDAVGVSSILLVSLLLAIYLLTTIGCYIALKTHLPKLNIVSLNSSPVLITILAASLLALSGKQLQSYLTRSDLSAKEPFRLTLFSGKPYVLTPLSGAIKSRFNTTLDQQEETFKAKYHVGNNVEYKNIILIIVDALRSDHMGVYGYQRETTPYLTSLRKKGQLTKINNIHGSCAESTCGISSIVSSKYAHQLPSNPFTLQQVLKINGYEINMILGGDHTNYYNLKDIYGSADNYFDGSMETHFYMNDDSLVINRVKSLPQWNSKPTMFQFHLMSSHHVGKHLSQFEKFTPHKSYLGYSGGPKEQYTNHYDNGVLQTDSMIHDLIDLLHNKNYLQNALIIITADHGESLGEHQLFHHANSVREELFRIPLLLIDFNKKNRIHSDYNPFVTQVDIAPTILHEMRIPIPEGWHGHPIQIANDPSGKPNLSFFQLMEYVGFYDYRSKNQLYKYWIDTNTYEEFAFDMINDPNEHDNLIMRLPDKLKNEWRKIAISTRLH